MSDAKEMKLSLKVMVNKEQTKVLFAEADNHFVDVLLSFLTLPLGKILRLLQKHYGDEAPVIGSLTTLYNGVANLDSGHFWTEGGKQMLLNPRSSSEAECQKLKLNLDDAEPIKYFRCGNSSCNRSARSNISIYYSTAICDCGNTMNREIDVTRSQAAGGDGGVFIVDATSFIICDDLRILPNVSGFLETMRILGITDTYGAKLKDATIGFNEIMDLLKGSLLSSTPLSDFILKNRHVGSATVKPEPGILLCRTEKEAISNSDSKKMILKVLVQKSTNKLLFAQAKEDLLEVLFSFLTIPLGGVRCLLGKGCSLKNIDNLYWSMKDAIDDKYFRSLDRKTRLVESKLPCSYISKNQILPLTEDSTPRLRYYPGYQSFAGPVKEYLMMCPSHETSFELISSLKSPKGLQGKYVKGSMMYMVSDDLTVTPFCLSTSISILNELGIGISDVKEVELPIGLEEVLSVLNASLTSTSALTNGLIGHQSYMKKQLKQENLYI